MGGGCCDGGGAARILPRSNGALILRARWHSSDRQSETGDPAGCRWQERSTQAGYTAKEADGQVPERDGREQSV